MAWAQAGFGFAVLFMGCGLLWFGERVLPPILLLLVGIAVRIGLID